MASELRVNTLKDAAGNNSIATSFVAGGSAKAWCFFDGTAGTISFADSLNGSSLTDSATGQYIMNFTSAMSNTTYPCLFIVEDRNDNQSTSVQTSSSSKMFNRKGIDGSSAVDNDAAKCQFTAHGDLA